MSPVQPATAGLSYRPCYNRKVKQNATLDSSFWINAHRAGLSEYVLDRFTLWYPSAVAAELQPRFPSGAAFWANVEASGLSEANASREATSEYGPGERAAINVALEHRDWLLLMDDHRPYQEAARQSLRVLCTPVLVTMLLSEGVLDARSALAALARLAALQTVSPHLIAAALAQLGRIWQSEGSES